MTYPGKIIKTQLKRFFLLELMQMLRLFLADIQLLLQKRDKNFEQMSIYNKIKYLTKYF